MTELSPQSNSNLTEIEKDKIIKAFRIEFNIMADQPSIHSKELRGWMFDEAWGAFVQYGGLGSTVVWGAKRHPAVLAISAVVLAAIKAKELTQYKDYSSNQKEFGLALMVLFNSTPEDLNGLSLPVLGGLLRFTSQVFVERFSNRLSALKALPHVEQEDDEVIERINIYENGLKESIKLEERLLLLASQLEANKKTELDNYRVTLEQEKQQALLIQRNLDLKYKAGLISQQVYSAHKSKTQKSKLKYFSGKAEAFLTEKIVQIDGSDQDLEFFCKKIFPDFKKKRKGKFSALDWTVIIVAIAIVIFILGAYNQPSY